MPRGIKKKYHERTLSDLIKHLMNYKGDVIVTNYNITLTNGAVTSVLTPLEIGE